MNKTHGIRRLLAAGAAVLLLSAPAFADQGALPAGSANAGLMERLKSMTPAERDAAVQNLQQQWQQMTPEERNAAKDKAREYWQQMSPEDKEKARQAMRERWDAMTPEQKQELKQHLEEFRHQQGGANNH